MYGTNNEGKTCGTGSFEGKKYVAYPRLSEDVRAAAVEIGTQDNPASMAEVADNLDKLHLFGICADSCPQAGDKLKDSEGTSYTFYLNTRSSASLALSPTWSGARPPARRHPRPPRPGPAQSSSAASPFTTRPRKRPAPASAATRRAGARSRT